MTIAVKRMAPDGLVQQVWTFDACGAFSIAGGFVLRLESYHVERRPEARGRFRKVKPEDRWSVRDERTYYSGLKRPTDIPGNVIAEAIAAAPVEVKIANTTLRNVRISTFA
jgi:hypothetical protein